MDIYVPCCFITLSDLFRDSNKSKYNLRILLQSYVDMALCAPKYPIALAVIFDDESLARALLLAPHLRQFGNSLLRSSNPTDYFDVIIAADLCFSSPVHRLCIN